MKWNDVSTDQDHSKILIAKAGLFKIAIVYNHLYFPDIWVLTCLPFFDVEPLDNLAVGAAKFEAIVMIRKVLKNALEDLK